MLCYIRVKCLCSAMLHLLLSWKSNEPGPSLYRDNICTNWIDEINMCWFWWQQNLSYYVIKLKGLQEPQICILSASEHGASLLPLAHLAAWKPLLICPPASVSTSPIWTGIKGPNANSCAEIRHVSIYSNLCNHTLFKITSFYTWLKYVMSACV